MYLCMFVCTYIYYVCARARGYVCMYVCMNAHVYVCVYILVYACLHECIDALHNYVHMHSCL